MGSESDYCSCPGETEWNELSHTFHSMPERRDSSTVLARSVTLLLLSISEVNYRCTVLGVPVVARPSQSLVHKYKVRGATVTHGVFSRGCTRIQSLISYDIPSC